MSELVRRLKVFYYKNALLDIEASLKIFESKSVFNRAFTWFFALEHFSTPEKVLAEARKERE
jgi:hypothetical protein